MKAMILCAGLGTRLKPWTLSHPKALVPVGGVPMLSRVAASLRRQGFSDIVLNVHHFASQIEDFVKEGHLNPSKVSISDESDLLLDTGGGILKAAPLLVDGDEPFLIHNVDILSNADLRALREAHIASGRDVTLLVSDRDSSRKLAFDSSLRLRGWKDMTSGHKRPEGFSPWADDSLYAFSGIYMMSPSAIAAMRSQGFSGSFPIMDFFLSSIGTLHIGAEFQSALEIIDIGKPDTLRRAELIFQ